MLEPDMPPSIGTHVLVRRSAPCNAVESGIVVGHFNDPSLGYVLEFV
jgi:hypothetical protein